MKRVSVFLVSLVLMISLCSSVLADDSILNISEKNISHEVSDTLYGAFIEDISFACDGGLVSNLVNNSSFEYTENPEAAWAFESVETVLSTDSPMNQNNPSYEILSLDGRGYIENIGFPEVYDYKTYDYNEKTLTKGDMGFKKGEKYDFSVYLKNIDFEGSIGVFLNSKSNDDSVITLSTKELKTNEWSKFSATLKSKADEDGSLVITFNGTGSIALDFASLIPQSSYGYSTDTWKYTSLRSDLFTALKDLKPAFIRFPGGCLAEGTDINNLYNWKNTVGPLEERKQSPNLWGDSANGKNYNNTNAMGYHEYFQLCEDIGAEAVPVVNAGMICQGRCSFDDHRIALKKASMSDSEWKNYLINERGYNEDDEEGMKGYSDWLDSFNIKSEQDYEDWLDTVALRPGTPEYLNYVQDVLDLIEYANADSQTSYWGSQRAANGHETPFNIKYIAVGNENWSETYFRNFEGIYKAIKEKYPDITIVTTAGAASEGSEFEYSWSTVNEKYADTIVDEHYYTGDNYLFEHNDRYDSYDRDGAGVLIGEYSTKSAGFGTMETKTNIWSAVEIASYLTGLERNGDIVKMSSYAPAFAKVNANGWDINMIWFDSQGMALTPDYYVQMLFSNNTGSEYVETASVDEEVYQSVTVDKDKQIIYIKLVNTGSSKKININLDGFDNINAVSNQYLSHRYKSASNEINRQRVAPREEEIKANGSSFKVDLKSNSVNVIRVAYGENTGDSLYLLPDDISLETKGYVPARVTVTVIIIAVCLIAGAFIAYRFLKKKPKKQAASEEDE